MRCHDILGVYVYDPIEKIEEAYRNKIERVTSSDTSDNYKNKKILELKKAHLDCLEYSRKSFNEKITNELADTLKTSYSSGNLYSCCSGCVPFAAICILIFAIGRFSFERWQAAENRRRQEEAEAQRKKELEEAKKRSDHLNSLISQNTSKVNNCIRKRGTLNGELAHRQELLKQQQRNYEICKNTILTFCRNIELPLTEAEVTNSPAVTALKKDLQEAEEAVNRANRAINENEKLIVSGQQEAQNAMNELRR